MDRRVARGSRTQVFNWCASLYGIELTTWWKENNTSLILAPDAIIEEIETRMLKKRSLELAGSFIPG